MLMGARAFGAGAKDSGVPDPIPGGLNSGRLSGNPSFYNKRFEPSQSIDGVYFENNSRIHGASGFAPHQTNRDPTKFQYSDNIFKNDYWEFKMRASDYCYQIFSRLHRSNDGWTRCLLGWTAFSFLMMPQAMIWKIHFAFFGMATAARIRDKGAEPTLDEVAFFDKIFANEKLSQYFNPKTFHVIDYDQEWDEGYSNPYTPEYNSATARFFNADTNSTTGLYKIGDVESGATMTVSFKTMAYANNKYNFSEPFLILDMKADVSANGEVFTEHLVKAEDVLKTKRTFVPWH